MKPLILILALHATAYGQNAEIAKPQPPAGGTTAATSAPVCLNQGVPPKVPEEQNVKDWAEKANLSAHEVLSRLIFAETLSTGYWQGLCPEANPQQLMENIGWGVMNRVAKARGMSDPVYYTVFASGQFRTSFSIGRKANPFALSFRCPDKAQEYLDTTKLKGSAKQLYAKAQDVAEKILTAYHGDGGIPKSHQGITNFFYPKSEYFGHQRPFWASDKDPSKNFGYLTTLSNTCLEMYNLKAPQAKRR